MNDISRIIKLALENTVLCRGANSAKESYQYAEKMEVTIKRSIIQKLNQIQNSNNPVSELKELVKELEGKEEEYEMHELGYLVHKKTGVPITG